MKLTIHVEYGLATLRDLLVAQLVTMAKSLYAMQQNTRIHHECLQILSKAKTRIRSDITNPRTQLVTK